MFILVSQNSRDILKAIMLFYIELYFVMVVAQRNNRKKVTGSLLPLSETPGFMKMQFERALSSGKLVEGFICNVSIGTLSFIAK